MLKLLLFKSSTKFSVPSAFHLALKKHQPIMTSQTGNMTSQTGNATSQQPLDLRVDLKKDPAPSGPLNLVTKATRLATRPVHYSPHRKPRLQYVPNNVGKSQLLLRPNFPHRRQIKVPIPVRNIAHKYATQRQPPPRTTAPPGENSEGNSQQEGKKMCTVLVPKRKFLKCYLDSCQGNSPPATPATATAARSVDSSVYSDPSSNGSSPSQQLQTSQSDSVTSSQNNRDIMTSQTNNQNIFLNLASKVM